MSKIGEKLSFYQLFSDKGYNIKVPIIQRDFAQGRDGAEEVRKSFSQSLYDAIDNDVPLHLDFVYGSIEKDEDFIPLDGQQRLTTLFLLHWYLATISDNADGFREILLSNNESRFTYETRISTREFCTAIVQKGIEVDKLKTVSDVLKNQPWFSSTWLKDPSVNSMLVVLDTIHSKFIDSTGFYDKLKESDPSIITFQFIQLEHFGLTDNLYIKMNARGKELTPFENFKAEFEEYLDDLDKAEGTSFKEEFAHKIDKDWTETFWSYKNERNLFDEEIYTFISKVLTYFYSLTVDPREYFLRLRAIANERTLSFTELKKVGALNATSVGGLISFLDLISGTKGSITSYIDNKRLLDEDALFNSLINDSTNAQEELQHYALYMYLSIHGIESDYKTWIRFIRNVSENTRYAQAGSYHRALLGVQQALESHTDLLKDIVNEELIISGLSLAQLQEEQIKATLILKSDRWKKAIHEIEDHGYFLGQIDFLLDFSGIRYYFDEHKHLNWDANDDDEYFKKFQNKAAIACSLFDDSGVINFGQHLLERALLVYGDYLLEAKSNFSFLINNKGIREISWKRLLRNADEHRQCLKMLFTDIDLENVTESLQRVIDDSKISDWRRYFIQYPELISDCGSNKYIRFVDEHDIRLLKTTRIHGHHYEYYTRTLFHRLRGDSYDVSYETATNEVDFPMITSIEGKSIEISYEVFIDAELQIEGPHYAIYFNDEYEYRSSQDEVIDFLVESKIIG